MTNPISLNLTAITVIYNTNFIHQIKTIPNVIDHFTYFKLLCNLIDYDFLNTSVIPTNITDFPLFGHICITHQNLETDTNKIDYLICFPDIITDFQYEFLNQFDEDLKHSNEINIEYFDSHDKKFKPWKNNNKNSYEKYKEFIFFAKGKTREKNINCS